MWLICATLICAPPIWQVPTWTPPTYKGRTWMARTFERWLEGAANDPARGYTRTDFVEHIRSEYSTFRWLLEPMLAAAGFEVVTADFGGSVYGAYTCRRR